MGKVKIGYSPNGSGGSGGKGDVKVPDFYTPAYISPPPGQTDGIWISAYNYSRDYLFVPKVDSDASAQPNFFGETKPFKIHVRLYINDLSMGADGGNTNTLFGSVYDYANYPSMDMHYQYFWGGISYNGGSWSKSIELLPKEGETQVVEKGKIYSVEYGWDGENLYIKLYNDEGELINSASVPETQGHVAYGIDNSHFFAFGGLCRSRSHQVRNSFIDILNTYVEIDGEVKWGNKNE